MYSIWKFTLETTDEQSITMPLDAKILDVQIQNGNPQIWCLVNINKKTALRHIRIIGTGHPIPDDLSNKYVGTYQIIRGTGVFHVFDYGY